MSPILSQIFNNLNKKTNSTICRHIDGSLFFDFQNRVKFCPYYDCAVSEENLDGIWLDIDKTEQKRQELRINKLEKCQNCNFFEAPDKQNLPPIKTLYLANWHFCYVNCTYCKYPKQEDLIQAGHYDVFPFVKELTDKKLVTPKTKIVFDCGDACVHPEFDKIMFYFLNNDFKNIEVNTSAQRFCESVAQGIAKNTTKVIVSFDCGCQYIYHRIKQINKFDIAVNNIKKYLKYQMPSQKNVILKYTIIQGINDNKKEPLDLFIFARDLGVNKLIFDIEEGFYERSLNYVPQHIREIMEFIKKISSYNAYDIEFAPRLKVLFKKLQHIKKAELK